MDTPRTLDFQVWLRQHEERRARAERVAAAFGGYRRERPRDPEEAALLREIGTPDHLIGPIGARRESRHST